jgi:hypothetical protein
VLQPSCSKIKRLKQHERHQKSNYTSNIKNQIIPVPLKIK